MLIATSNTVTHEVHYLPLRGHCEQAPRETEINTRTAFHHTTNLFGRQVFESNTGSTMDVFIFVLMGPIDDLCSTSVHEIKDNNSIQYSNYSKFDNLRQVKDVSVSSTWIFSLSIRIQPAIARWPCL